MSEDAIHSIVRLEHLFHLYIIALALASGYPPEATT